MLVVSVSPLQMRSCYCVKKCVSWCRLPSVAVAMHSCFSPLQSLYLLDGVYSGWCGCSVADRLKCEQSLDERLKNEFMLQQLVNLVSSLDLSDELARSVVTPSLALYCVPHLLQCLDTVGWVKGRTSGQNG